MGPWANRKSSSGALRNDTPGTATVSIQGSLRQEADVDIRNERRITHVHQVTEGEQADVDERVILWVVCDDGHQSWDDTTLD